MQIMMASRVLYGMGSRGLGLRYFAAVNPRTRTSLAATAIVTAVVLILALWLPMVTLAEITSFIILLVFTLVNFSL
ncbi:MAG: amino acid permease, partial [Gammaproteobacteria bacterium]|nr:amino acid permease [Gammaproteobacteria bacterium]